VAEKQKRKRLFLALWPDDITRKKLADVQKQLGKIDRLKTAKPVAVANLHITTHFLGAVTDEVHAQLQALLSEVKAQSCTLVIDHWGYFPRAKVLWLGADSSAALNDLVEQTQSCIQQCIDGYEQKRFVPHVTLFRKARHPMEVDDFHPIEWHIDRFALVESVTHPEGPEYRVLKEWMLS
jgi:2'-5' RNA ligase